jgi:MYXO-CTERM domain-containing protein
MLIAACVDQPDQIGQVESQIVGGTTAQTGDWPDAVAVLGSNGTCTGTLIAPDVVLTAGHCAGIDPQQVIANTVDYSQDDGGVRVHVAKTTAYPNWQTSYDVAVLELASPIKDVAPRKIGTSCTFERFERQTAVRLVGFGATDMAGRAGNTQLKEAMTAVLDPECTGGKGCKKAIAPGGEFVAGGTGEADSCFGDSGGPVYLDTPMGAVVVGAVSRGVEGSATPCGGGGIYVRTDKLVDWIEETTEKAVEVDDCAGTAYRSGDDIAGDGQGGCAVGGGAGAGAIGLVLLALRRRRR